MSIITIIERRLAQARFNLNQYQLDLRSSFAVDAQRQMVTELESLLAEVRESPQVVYVVRLPSDEREVHVFADPATAGIVADAVEGTLVTEEPIQDEAWANHLVESEDAA